MVSSFKDIPKFTVTVITYNQQDLIGRALDSLLLQQEWIHEIIICDDCSKDNNWKVILNYQNEHPGKIKAYRNDANLGIYSNIEKTWGLVTGDLVLLMAGDDIVNPGIFEKVSQEIDINKIDYRNKAIAIFGNFRIKYPNGFIRNIKNNKRVNNPTYNLMSLKVRGLINTYGIFSSHALIKQFQPVPKDIGMFCDELIDIQHVLFSEERYYFDFCAITYHAKIGVSVKNKNAFVESMNKTDLVMRKSLPLNQKDLLYLDYLHHRRNLLFVKKSIKHLYLTIVYYFKSRDLSLGLMGLDILRVILDLRRLVFVKISK